MADVRCGRCVQRRARWLAFLLREKTLDKLCKSILDWKQGTTPATIGAALRQSHAPPFHRTVLVAPPVLRRMSVPHPKPSPRGEGAERSEADEVFPDVTHHGNSVFAPLDQCHGRFGRNVMAASGTAGDASPVQRTPHPSRRDRRATFPSRGRLESAQRYRPCAVYPTTPHPSRRDRRATFPSRGRHRLTAMHDLNRGGPCPLGLPCGSEALGKGASVLHFSFQSTLEIPPRI